MGVRHARRGNVDVKQNPIEEDNSHPLRLLLLSLLLFWSQSVNAAFLLIRLHDAWMSYDKKQMYLLQNVVY